VKRLRRKKKLLTIYNWEERVKMIGSLLAKSRSL